MCPRKKRKPYFGALLEHTRLSRGRPVIQPLAQRTQDCLIRNGQPTEVRHMNVHGPGTLIIWESP